LLKVILLLNSSGEIDECRTLPLIPIKAKDLGLKIGTDQTFYWDKVFKIAQNKKT